MRGHLRRFGFAIALMISTGAALGISPTPAAAATKTETGKATATAPAPPACTFDGATLPIVTGVSGGTKITISCTGLSPLHPYLLLETSLLIGIDPKAAALLSGGATPSPALLESALAALPEINPASFALPLSDLSGTLNDTYTVPSFQPLDPNANCPPSVPEFNSGLIGCALAMVDLTTQKPVAAGSAVLEWTGYPLLPPDPTVSFSTAIARPGGQVNVSDAPGATSYWWIATLASLESLLGGSAPAVTLSVAFEAKHHTFVSAAQNLAATSASYDGRTLTPPSISGSFTVPSGLSGKHKVFVSLGMPLEGFGLQITAEQPLAVTKR
ncbi:MAG TPA: hypothetical protein VNC61_09195 [Acidimicrobiales bacterium]|nr:hypothetical protein [Acidimicrobiales bacterium]